MIKIINSKEYKPIPLKDCSDYLISNDGYVFSVRRDKLVKYRVNSDGYWCYTFWINSKAKTYSAHRLVALTYVDNINSKPYVNHRDGIKENNHHTNLEWVTPSENVKHAYATGLKSNKGDNHPRSKLTERLVLELRELHSKGGITYKKIADKYNVSTTSISRAIRGITFNHI